MANTTMEMAPAIQVSRRKNKNVNARLRGTGAKDMAPMRNGKNFITRDAVRDGIQRRTPRRHHWADCLRDCGLVL